VACVGAAARAAVAVAAAIAEEEAWPSPARIAPAELVRRTGLTLAEVGAGLDALEEAGLLERIADEHVRLDADLSCGLPVLAQIEWGAVRARLAASARVAPALAVLREVARSSPVGANGAGDWVALSVGELVEETLYGRTAVTQALQELVEAGALERADQPARRGLRLRVTAHALGVAPSGDAAAQTPTPESSSGGLTLHLRGVELQLPAGTRLTLPPGLSVDVEARPDGSIVLRAE
jgi:DNA-binding MarR family transcriptional regulator